MGCTESLPQNMEKNIGESCCKMINDENPSLEEVKPLIMQIPNRDRKKWPDCKKGPLICAAAKNRKDLIKFMVKEAKFDVNAEFDCKDDLPFCWCALGVAIRDCNEELASFLVNEMSADISLLSSTTEPMAVCFMTAWAWDEKMINLVYKDLGADINQNIDGIPGPQNVLQWAIVSGMTLLFDNKFDDLNDWNVVKLFLELGADPNVITSGKYQQDDQYRFLEFNTGKEKGTAAEVIRSAIPNIPFKPYNKDWEKYLMNLVNILEDNYNY